MRIAGGLNLYAFPPNAVGWADPFGLVKKSAIPAANWDRIQKLPEGPGIYVLEGNGVKYVGSGVDMKARICDSDHAKAENILKDPNCKISYHEVKRNPNDPGHSLKVAEQTIMKKENIVPVPGSKTQNSIPALGEDKFDLYSNDPNCTPVVMRKKAIK